MDHIPDNEDELEELDAQATAFVHEYIIDRNGTQAAKRAGFKGKNPAWYAWKTLQRPIVQATIQQLTTDKLAEIGLRSDAVLAELTKIAFSTMGDLLDDQGRIDFERVRDFGHLIESYNLQESEGAEGGRSCSVKVKLHSKMAALDRIGKYLGVLKEAVVVDHTNSDGSLSPMQRLSDEELKQEAAKRGLPTSIFGS